MVRGTGSLGYVSGLCLTLALFCHSLPLVYHEPSCLALPWASGHGALPHHGWSRSNRARDHRWKPVRPCIKTNLSLLKLFSRIFYQSDEKYDIPGMFSVAITKSLRLSTLSRKEIYLARRSEVSEWQQLVGYGQAIADGLVTDGLMVVGMHLEEGFRADAKLDYINPFSPELIQSNRQT